MSWQGHIYTNQAEPPLNDKMHFLATMYNPLY